MHSVLQVARLNARVAGLALHGRWLGNADLAAGYDAVAPTYNEVWLRHLRGAANELLGRLPGGRDGVILDLGAGTGYCAKTLARNNPAASVIAVDISTAMLARAAFSAPPNLRLAVCDMLEFVRSWEAGSPSLIVSTWAMGYSRPARLIHHCGRVLAPEGLLAFIVNYRNTLAPVFQAYQECMARFPDRVRLAAFPHFPRNWLVLEQALERARLDIVWHKDDVCHIHIPAGPALPWLRQTGILAGFEQMLDLSGNVAAHFEQQLARGRDGIFHHFAMAIARKK